MNDLIVFQDGQLSAKAANLIAAVETETARMIEQRDFLRAEILKAMEENGVKKLDTPAFCISYIAPADREVFDKKALKSEMPDIYEAYASFSPVKSSVRVKLK